MENSIDNGNVGADSITGGENTRADNAAMSPRKLPKNRHAMDVSLQRMIFFGVLGAIMALSYLLIRFVIWPAITLVITVLFVVFGTVFPFIFLIFGTSGNEPITFEGMWGRFINDFPPVLNVIAIILTVLGIICLVQAVMAYLKYEKKIKTSNNAGVQPAQGAQEETVDLGNWWFYVLGVFCPIVGIPMWLVWRKSNPVSSKQCLAGSVAFLLWPMAIVISDYAKAGDVEGVVIALILSLVVVLPVFAIVSKIRKQKAAIIAEYTRK